MSVTVTYEDPHEFAKRHGGNGVHITDRKVLGRCPQVANRIVYSDGSTCTDFDWQPKFHEPPADPLLRLAFRRAYADEILRRKSWDYARTAQWALNVATEAAKQVLVQKKRERSAAHLAWAGLDSEYRRLWLESPAGKAVTEAEQSRIENERQRLSVQDDIKRILVEKDA